MKETKFKDTEIGRIPEDWDVVKLSDKGSLLRGSINPQMYPHKKFVEFSMPSFDEGKKPEIKDGISMQSGRTCIYSPVLLYNKLNVRQRRIWYVESCPEDSICSMEFLPYVSDKINLNCLKYVVNTNKVTADFEGMSKGTSNSQKRIAPSDFLDYKIAMPHDVDEQSRIATALSSIENLIFSLDKLIEKKKNIKQGTIQQLLSGKKRIKGFSEPWSEFYLGNVSQIYRGGSPRPIEEYITNQPDGINWIKIGDVSPKSKYIVSTKEKIKPSGANRSRFVHKGDFILSNSMSFGRPYILDIDGCIHDGWLVIQDYQETFDLVFLYYMLGSEEVFKQYKEMAAGSSVQNLNKDKVASVIIKAPKSKKEQSAIAAILSSMDNEITALETKKAKYESLKQGMMQQLLTGKIRLI